MTDHCAVPLLYALLEEKSFDSYSRVFQAIQTQLPNWTLTYAMADFELAALNALKVICCCYFNYYKLYP